MTARRIKTATSYDHAQLRGEDVPVDPGASFRFSTIRATVASRVSRFDSCQAKAPHPSLSNVIERFTQRLDPAVPPTGTTCRDLKHIAIRLTAVAALFALATIIGDSPMAVVGVLTSVVAAMITSVGVWVKRSISQIPEQISTDRVRSYRTQLDAFSIEGLEKECSIVRAHEFAISVTDVKCATSTGTPYNE